MISMLRHVEAVVAIHLLLREGGWGVGFGFGDGGSNLRDFQKPAAQQTDLVDSTKCKLHTANNLLRSRWQQKP